MSRVVERSVDGSPHSQHDDRILIDYASAPPQVWAHWDVIRAVEAADTEGVAHTAMLDRLPDEGTA